MIRSSARRWSSNAMPYCIPEHPPPLTKMRRARPGLSSLESNSLRRDWATGVSETRACSITFGMLPALSGQLFPIYRASTWPRGDRLPPTQLESFLLALALGRRGAGDDLG